VFKIRVFTGICVLEKQIQSCIFDQSYPGAPFCKNQECFIATMIERRIEMSSTPQHCPGFQNFKDLKSFVCKCPECGEEKEIFSDEFDRPHTCRKCNSPIDFNQCKLEGQAGTSESA
jgi:hypothetical protein